MKPMLNETVFIYGDIVGRGEDMLSSFRTAFCFSDIVIKSTKDFWPVFGLFDYLWAYLPLPTRQQEREDWPWKAYFGGACPLKVIRVKSVPVLHTGQRCRWVVFSGWGDWSDVAVQVTVRVSMCRLVCRSDWCVQSRPVGCEGQNGGQILRATDWSPPFCLVYGIFCIQRLRFHCPLSFTPLSGAFTFSAALYRKCKSGNESNRR